MKFLFDLQHPAHLHFFRPIWARLRSEGHQIFIAARKKDILEKLAKGYDIPMAVFGTAKKGVFHLGKEWFYRVWRLNRIIRSFKPDALIAIAGTFISILGKLRGIPTYIFYDTEHATISNLLAYPFASCIYVPGCYRKRIRWKHVRYDGYHELAYLHPKYFSPSDQVLETVGLQKGELYIIARFVGWTAGHDIGRSGLSNKNKIRSIKEFEKYGRVLISSEAPLPPELEPYTLKIDETQMHSLLSNAALIFGESATMVSEGAVLGVPGIYVDPVGRGYTDEQQNNYGIVFHYTHKQQNEAINHSIEILKAYKNNFQLERQHWQKIGKRIVQDKIDVTNFIYKVILQSKN